MNPVKDLKLLKQYQALLKTEVPDLILTYTIKPNLYGGIAARGCRIPYAMNITGLGIGKSGIPRQNIIAFIQICCRKSLACILPKRRKSAIYAKA